MKPTLVSPAEARSPYFVGVQFSDDHARAGVVDDSGRLLSWLTEPAPLDRGPEAAPARSPRSRCERSTPPE